jgi:hypothetical protein
MGCIKIVLISVMLAYLTSVPAGDRATEFGQRCRRLGIQGVTLHSYRYAWAECSLICFTHFRPENPSASGISKS